MARDITFDILARDKASQTFDNVGKHSDGLGKKLAGFGVKALAGTAAAVGALGVAAGVMGLKTAAANEQAQISFTTMLGSAQKAGKFIHDLQAFAAATPFDFPGLQTAASSLISAGINADKVIPIMRTLGDVTSGMGTGSEGVQRATVALQQMNAAGKITGEDLNQLRDAGIPVYDLLSKATGKSKAEIVKLAQQGKLGKKALDQMMAALENGKGLERFSGLMDKQSKSLTGLWSTFKDTLGQGLAKAIEPLIPLIKDGLGRAADFLAKVLPKVAAGLAGFIKGIKDGTGVGGKFRHAIEQVIAKVKIFVQDFKSGYGAAGTFKTALKTAGDVIVKVTGFLTKHSTAVQVVLGMLAAGFTAFKVITGAVRIFTAAQAILNVVLTANPIGLVIIAIAALVAGLIIAYKKSETFRDIVNGALHAIAVAAQWLWNSVLKPVITFILTGFASVALAVGHVLQALGKIPGFGWAKKAGDMMVGAAKAAQGLADKLNELPRNKTVTVNTYFKTHGNPNPLSAVGSGAGVKGYAVGGTNLPRGWKLVGEQGPELMWTPGGDTVIPSRQSRSLMNGGGGSGGVAGGGDTYVFNISGVVGDERSVADKIHTLLLAKQRQSGVGLGFKTA